ncbi:MAG: D-tyrosyl-tRNA(Tyr) deacylase [Clostridiales bacterium]|nr:D-tyrosyl-tRNA(Tyr) deacylase [Clostridiales bacterium]
MRVVIQRVKSASLKVDDELISEIGNGLLVLCGIEKGEDESKIPCVAEKIANLRIFERDDKMDLSVLDVAGEILLVSNFTLCTDRTKAKGNRPYFGDAENPERANELYLKLRDELNKFVPTKTGVFGADMQTDAHLDGPVTIYKEF